VLAITTAATIGTAPLMAIHFGQVSLASLPANLLAAIAVAPVMWLGMLATAAAQLTPTAAIPPAACAGPLLAFIEWVAHMTAAAPWAVVPLDMRHPPLALLAALAAALAWLLTDAALRRSPR
jgi:competence protein ComEC